MIIIEDFKPSPRTFGEQARIINAKLLAECGRTLRTFILDDDQPFEGVHIFPLSGPGFMACKIDFTELKILETWKLKV